ncbi:MAG: dihydroorotate dehydrogenase [Candidatus Omnitrophica bacterium]|nr:dihydroorotate dehydrogenase [Candidatus Omnitrophota bacterium]
MVKKYEIRNLEVKIGKMALKNPVIAASGTFGYGEEMSEFFDIGKLGAIVTKTITLKPREGNPTPRIIETASGMLNSIGLENKGLKDFIFNKVPMLEKLNTHVIVSIAGFNLKEFSHLTEELSKIKCISAIELNLSCPNVAHNPRSTVHRLIAQDRTAVRKIVSAARKQTKLTLITKLSPNVSDIKPIAKTAEDAGSDALSLINTVFGISVDIDTRKSNLANIVGGLSGPAIKPVALNFVREAYSAVKIPIIGMGGIMTARDAIEFIICGSTAVGVGTANFVSPVATVEIINGIMSYMRKNRIKNISSLVGNLK